MELAKEFIVVWKNGTLGALNGRQVSHMYDLSDCDQMDEVAAVYAVNEDNELVKVVLGDLTRDGDYDPDSRSGSIVYAYSAIMAGTKRVGTVHWTDH